MFRAAICAGRGCLVGDMCGVPPDGSLDVWTTPHGTKRGKRKMRTNLHLKTSFDRFDLLRYSRRLFFSRDTHLFISAAPNAFVFLILLVQIALVHCWLLFHGPAPREPLEASLPSGGRRDLEIQRSIGRTTRISGKGLK